MLIIMAIPITAMFIDQLFMRKNPFFCKLLDWHRNVEMKNFDGCSNVGVCKRCNKRVLQDSNGDWFTSSIQND